MTNQDCPSSRSVGRTIYVQISPAGPSVVKRVEGDSHPGPGRGTGILRLLSHPFGTTSLLGPWKVASQRKQGVRRWVQLPTRRDAPLICRSNGCANTCGHRAPAGRFATVESSTNLLAPKCVQFDWQAQKAIFRIMMLSPRPFTANQLIRSKTFSGIDLSLSAEGHGDPCPGDLRITGTRTGRKVVSRALREGTK